MHLNDALETIVSSRKVGEWMAIADHYLRNPANARDVDAMPEPHRLLLPILDKCGRDQRAFLRLLQSLRTSHPGASDKVLEALLQRVGERITEGHKRRLARRAAARFIRERIGSRTGAPPARQVESVARQLAAAWNLGFVQTMRDLCRVHPRHELELEEFTQFNLEFWNFVECGIEHGSIPIWGVAVNVGDN